MQLSFAWEFLGMHGPALVEIVAGVPEHVAAGFAVEIHWQNYHSDRNELYDHLMIWGQNFVGPHF